MFSEAKTKVVVISFGSKEVSINFLYSLIKIKNGYIILQGAETWLKETSCQLEMYLDPKRVVYNHLGLSRCVKKMNVKTEKIKFNK